jgi:hypothetical protein
MTRTVEITPADEILADWIKQDADRLDAARDAWNTPEHEGFTEFVFEEIANDNGGITELIVSLLEYAVSTDAVGQHLFGE